MPNQVVSFDEDKVTHEPVVIIEGRFNLTDLVNLLSEMQKRTGKMPAAITTGEIQVIPLVSHQTGMPMVELQSPAFDKPIQFDADQALEFGHTLVEVVAIAMNDATRCLAAYCPPIGILLFVGLYMLLNPWKRSRRSRQSTGRK